MAETMAERAGIIVPKAQAADSKSRVAAGRKDSLQASTPVVQSTEDGFDPAFLNSVRETLNDIPGFDQCKDILQDCDFGLPTPITPEPSNSDLPGDDGTPKNLIDIHENDRLRTAFQWTIGSPDDLEKLACERAGLEYPEGGFLAAMASGDDDMEMIDGSNGVEADGRKKGGSDGENTKKLYVRPELNLRSVFGQGSGLDFPSENWDW